MKKIKKIKKIMKAAGSLKGKNKYCNCDECYESFITQLAVNDPDMVPFAVKFRHRWVGKKHEI